MTKTVSAKIPEELKEELEQEGINVSDVIREALADELAARRREAFRRDATALREQVGGGVKTDAIVDVVRETREEH
ncbi:type II toxin-antitoxin system CcdA family antitoxin [Halococcus agarilyticus]|uniref:type II toxin-antitoxin system CcdA family antitoxin n=1 Tax=Halococcus agarilyticus TaxID=1232219 RepID=UPI0006781879|nr:type II toxin-antitoxin system CcdA family antitoxin [Halococcus agarilyticus]